MSRSAAGSPDLIDAARLGLGRGERRWLIAGVFLVVLAARWWLIAVAASPVPFWDQWYSDVADVRAVADGRFFRGLFAAHNEHRIVFTRLLNRTLLALDGQWDPLSQMFVTAVVHATFAAFLAGWITRHQTRLAACLLAFLVTAAYALPHAWQNTLWGFQSQYSFLLLFSLLALAWLSEARDPRGWRWWFGLAAGVASTLTMANGIVTGATLVALAVWRLVGDGLESKKYRLCLAIGATLTLLAWAVRADPPHHEKLWATDLSQTVAIFLTSLAWPNSDWPVLSVLAAVPLLLLAIRGFGSLAATTPQFRAQLQTVFLIAAWGVLQAAAFAVARGGAATVSFKAASRYLDLFALIPLACGALLIVSLQQRRQLPIRSRRWLIAFAAIWAGSVSYGMWRETSHVLNTELRLRREQDRLPARLLTALQRGAPDDLYARLSRIYRIWYPPERVRDFVSDARFAPWLPAELAPPEPLRWRQDPTGVLSPHEIPNLSPPAFYPSWSTWRSSGVHAVGRAVSEPLLLDGRAQVFALAWGGNPASIRLGLHADDGVSVIPFRLTDLPPETWSEITVHPHAGKWSLVLEVTAPDAWVILTGPRAISPIARTARLLKRVDTLHAGGLIVGFGFIVAVGVRAGLARRDFSARARVNAPSPANAGSA